MLSTLHRLTNRNLLTLLQTTSQVLTSKTLTVKILTGGSSQLMVTLQRLSHPLRDPLKLMHLLKLNLRVHQLTMDKPLQMVVLTTLVISLQLKTESHKQIVQKAGYHCELSESPTSFHRE